MIEWQIYPESLVGSPMEDPTPIIKFKYSDTDEEVIGYKLKVWDANDSEPSSYFPASGYISSPYIIGQDANSTALSGSTAHIKAKLAVYKFYLGFQTIEEQSIIDYYYDSSIIPDLVPDNTITFDNQDDWNLSGGWSIIRDISITPTSKNFARCFRDPLLGNTSSGYLRKTLTLDAYQSYQTSLLIRTSNLVNAKVRIKQYSEDGTIVKTDIFSIPNGTYDTWTSMLAVTFTCTPSTVLGIMDVYIEDGYGTLDVNKLDLRRV